jgi:hypothetical protein
MDSLSSLPVSDDQTLSTDEKDVLSTYFNTKVLSDKSKVYTVLYISILFLLVSNSYFEHFIEKFPYVGKFPYLSQFILFVLGLFFIIYFM